MKFGVVLLGMGLGMGFATGANKVPALPSWDEAERTQMLEEGWIAGAQLLSADDLEESEMMSDISATDEELSHDGEDEVFVSDAFIEAYFAEKPDRFLVDPQELVSSEERKVLEKFLKDHASDSTIDMFVYLFGEDQQIPSDVRVEELAERLFAKGKPAVIACYFLGSARRSVIYLSPSITDSVSSAEQRRATQSSVIRAMQTRGALPQLEDFLIQMSVRIYWMERMLDGTAIETMDTFPDGVETRVGQSKAATKADAEAEIPSWVGVLAGVVTSGVAVIALGWGLIIWLRKRARFVFPELDVEARLGASHAAGIGAVVSFASSSIPPARQREQVPDYLRRA